MQITLSETGKILKYIVENNKKLKDAGNLPCAVNLMSDPGIGKTSLVEQVANELGCQYVKLNLAQITEPSEMAGWPIKEHYVCKHDPEHPENDECAWITHELIEGYSRAGWEITNETRMSYAVPAWLANLDPEKPTIVNYDDFSRANLACIQSVLEVVHRQEYISWKLPHYTTVVLTSNYDDGTENVQSVDSATLTRMITFDVRFDIQSWAQWAERQELDSRGINFLLQYHTELMDKGKTKTTKVNARNYTMFINTISGIKDWSSSENLAFILQLASGCFLDDKENVVGHLFSTFIANKLDKLPTPDTLVTQKWDTLGPKLEALLYESGRYRPDLAAILSTRFCNYSLTLFEKKGTKTDPIVNRILEIIDNPTILFSEDLIFNLIKTLHKKYPARCNKMLMNPKIIKKLM